VLLTVIAALLAGGLGAIVATWLRGRHERAEAWRDRLVPAADDFATGVVQALLAGRDAKRAGERALEEARMGEATLPGGVLADVPSVKHAVSELERLSDEAHARLARVQLLFGSTSDAGKAADEAVTMLRRATLLFRESPDPDVEGGNRQINLAHDAHLRFAAAARAAIERGTIG
jgi:hypothetical protein